MRRSDLDPAVVASLVRLPHPFDSHYGVVPVPPPIDGLDLRPCLDRLVAGSAALELIETIAREIPDHFLISRVLQRQEAVSSSSIEGTNSTLDEILSIEETDELGGRQARQVGDYARVLESLLPKAAAQLDAIFTVDLIKTLHAQAMKADDEYKGEPGEFRTKVVWIGGLGNIANSTFNPPPPDLVEGCLEQTIEYLRNDDMQAMTHNVIVRMALAHAHFEAVHPFQDGNGRVGRLLLPLIMAADGKVPIYLSAYIEANKRAYYDALKDAQKRLEWTSMVGFVADALVATVDEIIRTRRALSSLRAHWATLRKFRKGSGSERALDLLPHYPIVTIKRLSSLLGVTFAQAAKAVEQLVEVGILVERTGYARNRVFSAPDVLTIINRPFGEDPVLPGGEDGAPTKT